MKRKDLIAAIRKVRGKLYVPVANFNDYIYPAVEKADLIKTLVMSFPNDTDETGFDISLTEGNYYLGKDYKNRD